MASTSLQQHSLSSLVMKHAQSTSDLSSCYPADEVSSSSIASKNLTRRQLNRLREMKYTRGLSCHIENIKHNCPLRIWIIDNSGSMKVRDGQLRRSRRNSLLNSSKEQLTAPDDLHERSNHGNKRVVPCSSRWEEIRECVNHHIRLASQIGAPTSFRLLNKPKQDSIPQHFGTALMNSDLEAPIVGSGDAQEALAVMGKVQPGGGTPLTRHILDIRQELVSHYYSSGENNDATDNDDGANFSRIDTSSSDDTTSKKSLVELQEQQERVAIIIATDGLPTDDKTGKGGSEQQEEFVESLRSLKGLPISIIIRLCTNEQRVVSFYHQIRDSLIKEEEEDDNKDKDDNMKQLLSIQVVTDFYSQARQIRVVNPWFNYALPLHRVREITPGNNSHNNETTTTKTIVDLLEVLGKRPLTREEIKELCILLFGDEQNNAKFRIPDPNMDWDTFIECIDRLQQSERNQWNAIKERSEPWINVNKLHRRYRRSSCASSLFS